MFGPFMYFYNTNNGIVAVLDTRDDEILEDYDDK